MSKESAHHVVVGSGPVGSTTAQQLAERGHEVTVLTRSGQGPSHPSIQLARADASDAASLAPFVEGAAAIYNCVNPPYHRWATDWPPMHQAFMKVAEHSGAVLVMMDNLYVFGSASPMPMREGDAMAATGTKGATRAAMVRELLEADESGRLRATLVRASDFFGPGVLKAAMGERVVPRVIAGKRVSVLGNADVPHSMSYMPDVAATLIAAAANERAWGRAWHVPNAAAMTQREFVKALASAAHTDVKVGTIPLIALRTLGVAMPMMRELKETYYQFDLPFVSDSALSEKTLGVRATPMDVAAQATVTWWRNRL